MIRSRERGAAFIAAIAVLAAGALLSMHIYTATTHVEPPASSGQSLLSLNGHTASPTGTSDHSTDSHASHGLVECCFWLLLSGLMLVIAFRSFRLRVFSQIARTLTGLRTATSQRAPPLTTRLCLVGVSRR